MARDYKHRAHPKRAQSKQPVAGWKWLLTLLLIAGFCYFLYSLRDEQPGDNTWQTVKNKVEVQKPKSEKVESKDQGPTFDFYTILPEKEVIVGDYPKKTQKQEKNVSKTKTSQYIIQTGAFTNNKDTDRLKAKLALMGSESRIQTPRVGGS